MTIVFLSDYRTTEAKQILELVKYQSIDLQTFLANHPHLGPVEVIGAQMWELLALLEGYNYDPYAVLEVVAQNYARVKLESQ